MATDISYADIAAARAQGERARAAGFAATSVRYDRGSRRFLLELTNGNLIGVPVNSLPQIAGASDDVLATVELLAGDCLHIEALDADYSVPGIIQNAFSQRFAARALGTAGGKVTSRAKAAAARANGAKGGRPKAVREKPKKRKR